MNNFNKYFNFYFFTVVLFFSIYGCSMFNRQGRSEKTIAAMIKQNLADGAKQYEYLASRIISSDDFPKSYDERSGQLQTGKSDDWISGFYPGSLLLLYKATGDIKLKAEADRIMGQLAKEQYNTTIHDIGFMMYNSFGNAYKMDSSLIYRQILLNSAKSLSTRFSPKVGSIRSWNSTNSSDFLVIIDNMMNLELLFWATKTTHDSSYYKIAVAHANTAMKNHFRADYSSYHLINYDAQTGKVKEKKTVQGYADNSSWARGQAWGLYGFTMMYRETGEKKYLDQATHIAEFILNNLHLPSDLIPYWDYNAPGEPNVYRDASAAAVMASALVELSSYVQGSAGSKYHNAAKTIIVTLSSDTYQAKYGTNGGFILKHSVGNFPAKSQIDVPLSYADYYFIEAMLRYNKVIKF